MYLIFVNKKKTHKVISLDYLVSDLLVAEDVQVEVGGREDDLQHVAAHYEYLENNSSPY